MACVKLSSPASVILRQLVIRANEMSNSCYYNLLFEIESDGVESCKMSDAL